MRKSDGIRPRLIQSAEVQKLHTKLHQAWFHYTQLSLPWWCRSFQSFWLVQFVSLGYSVVGERWRLISSQSWFYLTKARRKASREKIEKCWCLLRYLAYYKLYQCSSATSALYSRSVLYAIRREATLYSILCLDLKIPRILASGIWHVLLHWDHTVLQIPSHFDVTAPAAAR